jgi:hypothetical protein
MSSNNIFPIMSGDISPEQMCGDINNNNNNNNVVSTDWYTPIPVCLCYASFVDDSGSQLTAGI